MEDQLQRKYVTTKELGILLNMSANDVRVLARKKIIPTYKITDRKMYFDIEEVYAIMKKNKVK